MFAIIKKTKLTIAQIIALLLFLLSQPLFFNGFFGLARFLNGLMPIAEASFGIAILGAIGILVIGIWGRKYTLIRKITAFLISSGFTVLFLLLILLLQGDKDAIGIAIVASSFIFAVTLVLGVPVSIIADAATKSFQGGKRKLIALLVHLSFGLGICFILMIILFLFSLMLWKLVFIVSISASVLFWLTDEILRGK